MSTLGKIALTLLIIGGLNWLLVGLFNYDLVAAIFGRGSVLARAVYVIVGLCAIYCITLLFAPRIRERDELRRVA
jgi:uncharacterized protein